MSEDANRALLRRKFARPLPADAESKVTLTISGLCSLLQAARDEEHAKAPDPRKSNIDRVIDEAMSILGERR